MACRAPQIAVLLLLLSGCSGGGEADSRDPDYGDVDDRVSWIERQIHGATPSPILDAHFERRVREFKGGHMGLGRTMRFFSARLTIDPKDAPKWAARTKAQSHTGGNALVGVAAPWAMTADEAAKAAYYDPRPLFGNAVGGYMCITADNKSVCVYIRN